MSEQFVGQLMLASFNFAPKGWVFSNGQLLPINQNQALFSLLGTQYGGNGVQNFALPNLQGRTPVGNGNGFTIGQIGGQDIHTLTISEVPNHTHTISAAPSGANLDKPAGALLAGGGAAIYTGAGNSAGLNQGTLSIAGGSQPHENRQPYLVMSWCIALIGVFPTQN